MEHAYSAIYHTVLYVQLPISVLAVLAGISPLHQDLYVVHVILLIV